MPQFKFTKSFKTSVTQNTKKQSCFRKKTFLHNKLFVSINSSNLSWATKVIASLWSKLIGSHLKSNFILSCLKLLLAEFPLICCSLFGSKIRNVQTFCRRLKSTHDDANEYVYEVRVTCNNAKLHVWKIAKWYTSVFFMMQNCDSTNKWYLAIFWEVIYQTWGRLFHQISKHWEVGWKNEAQLSFFFNQLQSVWISD